METILLSIHHKGNRRLLKDWLAARYTVIEADNSRAPEQPFDLCILDAVAFSQREELILAHKEKQAPLFAPVLLVTQRKDVGLTTHNLWKTVDDLIILPIEKIELQARVHTLLLARRLAFQLKARDDVLLERSEIRYRALFEQSNDAVFILDLEGRHLDANQRAAEMFGYTREEMLMLSLNDMSAEAAESREALARLVAGERVAPYERLFRRKDGVSVPVEINVELVCDPTGQPLHLQSIVRDITARKWAEAQRERLLNILEASLNEIYIFDSQTLKFQYINLGAVRNLGYSLEQLRTMTPLDLKPEFTEDSFREMIGPVLRREKALHVFETVHRRADASLYPVEVHLQLAESLGERVFLAVILDITERKQAEEALRKSEQTFSVIFYKAPFAAALAGLPDGAYVEVNEEFERLLGYARPEMIGKTSLELGLYPDPEARARSAALFREQGFVRNLDMRLQTRTGEIHDVLINSDLVEIGGEKFILTTANDITDRKRTENELRAIYAASQSLQKLYTPDALARQVIQIVESLLGFEHSAVLLVDEARGMLTPFALSDQRRGPDFVKMDEAYIASREIKLGLGLTGWVAQTGQSVRLGDVRPDPRYFAVREDIRSELCVPLLAGERILGVVNIESRRPDAYSESDQRVLETVAAHIAVAIQNAQLLEQIQRHAAELEQRVAERTAELKEQYQRQATLEERQRLARDLHDVVSQTLFSASVIAETLPRLWERDPEQVRQGLGELHRLTRGALAEMRALLMELRPEAMVNIKLADLLGHLVNAIMGRTQLQITLTTEPTLILPAATRIGLYRIAQEALNNIVKHAHAHHVDISLVPSAAGILLRLRDDGRGFDTANITPGRLGLGIMRERAAAIGAALALHSQPEAGTEVVVTWPAP